MSEAMTGDPSRPAVGDLIDGKYRVTRMLGEGGMGMVVAAENQATLRPVALKLLHARAAAHPEIVARFRREASASNRIEHDGFVKTIDAGVWHGRPYLVMDLLVGHTAGEEVARRGPLPAGEAAAIVKAAAEALEAAHRAGIVHRDLKPENLFLLARAPTVESAVRILDLGIAKVRDAAQTGDDFQTREYSVLGTPATMSPEQCAGVPIDGRSDVYALGCVGYFLVAGRYPFVGSDTAIVAAHLREAPPPLATLAPTVPAALAAVLARCLEKEPARRWPSMAALAAALAPFATTGALGVTGPGRAGPTATAQAAPTATAARGRWVLGVAGGAVLAAAGGWAWSRIGAVRTRPMAETPKETAAAMAREAEAEPDVVPREPAPATVAPVVDASVGNGNAESAGTGKLVVTVKPWATVFVDGVKRDDTPLSVRVGGGEHRVRLVNPALGRREEVRVTLRAGATQRIDRDWTSR